MYLQIYLIIHALNKAFLFVLVGYTVHFFNGNTDMRQMGGSYLYSFDITVLLLGVCLNLAGLPYSAGFLGKEFLRFENITSFLYLKTLNTKKTNPLEMTYNHESGSFEKGNTTL